MRTAILSALLIFVLPVAAPAREVEEVEGLLAARLAAASSDPNVVTTWNRGARLMAAPQGLQLRSQPSTGAPTLGLMEMGDPVVVQKRGAKARLPDGMVNHWYKVRVDSGALKGRSGYVFGGFLTPFAFRADLDSDGRPEISTVSFTPDLEVRVRVLVRPPKGKETVTQVDLTPAGQAYAGRKGGQVKAALVPASEAGIPLLRLDSWIEQCGDRWTAYVSCTGSPPRAQLALLLDEVSDPPVSMVRKLRWVPGRQQAIVESTSTQEDEKGNEKTRSETRTYELKDGVYRELPASQGRAPATRR